MSDALNDSLYTACETVATLRNSFPGPGYRGINFDKVFTISDKIVPRVLTGGLQTYGLKHPIGTTCTPSVRLYAKSPTPVSTI